MASVHFQVPGCFGRHSREGEGCKASSIQIPDTPLPHLGPPVQLPQTWSSRGSPQLCAWSVFPGPLCFGDLSS